jgi:hypothetical protein
MIGFDFFLKLLIFVWWKFDDSVLYGENLKIIWLYLDEY